MNKNVWGNVLLSIVLLQMTTIVVGISPNVKKTWSEVKEKSKKMQTSAMAPAKQVKNTGKLATNAVAFAKSLQEEVNQMALLLGSLSITLSNISKASNTETQKVILTNALNKAGELLNLIFALTYEMDDLLNEAVAAKIIDKKASEKFSKGLNASLAFSTISMCYLRDKLVPELLQFLGSIEDIKKNK